MAPPPNDVLLSTSSSPAPASPSKLVHALNKSEATQQQQQQQQQQQKKQTMMSSSKSTPFQPHRRIRTTSFGVGPTPTRAPSMTIHQRRRTASGAGHLNNSITINNNKPDVQLLPRLEEENANLPPQDSIDFILAQIEKQNALLDEDPKSVCIQSNELKAHLSTMQNLVSEQQETTATNDQDNDIDWEFWTALTEDFGAVALKLPHLLSAKLKAGIPDKVRGVIWQAMTSSASLNLETLYGQLVVEHSPYERIIQRDLARTFPNVDMFKQEGGDGQQKLMRVLKAYSLYDVHVGYCQGLAFLVGPLLMNMPEQQAFCVFVRLMETYEMRTMFTLNMEGLQLRLYQFSSLLSQILPELSDHLADHAVHPPMYASQWFLTLFAYAFPIPLVMRIYDIIFAEGAPETIMRVAIAMLKHSQDELLAMNEFEDILDHVNSKLHLAYTTVNNNNQDGEETENSGHSNKKSNISDVGSLQIINEAMELSGLITREKMDHLADLYVRELEQEKKQTEQVLAVRFNFWSKDKDKKNNNNNNSKKRESGGWLSKRSSTSSGDESPEKQPSTPVSATTTIATTVSTSSTSTQPQQQDVATLHQQIEDLLLALSQIQKDHIQLKQELVQVRMDKMDVEAERDAMKMTLLDMEEQQEDQGPATEFSKMMSTTIQQQKHQLKMQQEQQENTVQAMQNELDRVQSNHFELQQQNEELRHQNEMAKQAQEGLIEKLVNMKNKMEQLESDHIKVVKERDSLKRQQQPLEQKLKDAEKTAHELQFEKLRLLDDLESIKEQRDQLTTPPQTPTPTSIGRRSSLMMTRNKSSSGVPTTATTTSKTAPGARKPRPQSVFVSSAETRCLELEQLLADAKLQIAELETFGPTSTSTSTKKINANKRRSFDPIALSRVASNQGLPNNPTSKRSSFYGRLWSSVTTANPVAQQQDTPPTSPI